MVWISIPVTTSRQKTVPPTAPKIPYWHVTFSTEWVMLLKTQETQGARFRADPRRGTDAVFVITWAHRKMLRADKLEGSPSRRSFGATSRRAKCAESSP